MSYRHRQARDDPPDADDEEDQSLLGNNDLTLAAPRSFSQPKHQHNNSSASASSSSLAFSTFDFGSKAWRPAAVAFVLLLALYNIITPHSIPKAESLPVSKIERMTGLLESSTIRYYVYDDDELVLSDIREKAIRDAPKTWRAKWGHRFFDYARGEIRWIEALERHPQRTRDPCEAHLLDDSKITVGRDLLCLFLDGAVS